MKIIYYILNLVTLTATGLALASVLRPDINDRIVDLAGPQLASVEAPCGMFFGYLVLSLLATVIGVIALCVQGFETARFPFYCVFLAWSPLVFLAILGVVLSAFGQLVW